LRTATGPARCEVRRRRALGFSWPLKLSLPWSTICGTLSQRCGSGVPMHSVNYETQKPFQRFPTWRPAITPRCRVG